MSKNIAGLVCCVVFASGLGAAASASPHPYLTWVHDPSTSVVVNWWNPGAAGDDTVEYGQTASYGSTAHNPAVSNFASPSRILVQGPSGRVLPALLEKAWPGAGTTHVQ